MGGAVHANAFYYITKQVRDSEELPLDNTMIKLKCSILYSNV